ncbi:MAG TPA: UbiA family prenyltransferase [Abditibacteriaceae bacterium]|nr:UbiA family prenyltransferase [Abditibacteriaceae bacterium]
MRSYFRLLRLPYQLQLGPIFAWGYFLGNGSFASPQAVLYFVAVFLIFHIAAFGGLTALNSFYDRDTGPVGGLWQPPPPPPHLWAFAWTVQISGFVLLLPLDWRLATVYVAIVLLALGYSHPRTRWKGHPWKSVAVVALGQGVLDFTAGALTAPAWQLNAPLWWGMLGATLTVIGYYPLTQLYQVADDLERGDHTTAAVLVQRKGRAAVFGWAACFLGSGICLNAWALACSHRPLDAIILLLLAPALMGTLGYFKNDASDRLRDFKMVHGLMRYMSLSFGCYVLSRLVWESLR